MHTDHETIISKTCTSARAFCLLSIIAAHIGITEQAPEEISVFWDHAASIGVIGFLIISAYYYRKNRFGSLFAMLKRKAVTVGIPWLVLGSAGYVYKVLANRTGSFLEYVRFLFGNGSYLYYLTVLFLCFIVFRFAGKKCCFALIGVSLISLMLTAAGVLDKPIEWLHITHYLNVFNWFGFFALGQLLQRIPPEKLTGVFRKIRIPCICVFPVIFILACVFKVSTHYFSYIGWAFNLLGVMWIFSVASFGAAQNAVAELVAKDSFPVYLIHLMVIGITDNFYQLSAVTQALAPLIVLAVSLVPIRAARMINDKLLKTKWIPVLIGYR